MVMRCGFHPALLWKICLLVYLYHLQCWSSINAFTYPLRLVFPPLCVSCLIKFSANFITITQMILVTGVSKHDFQLRTFLASLFSPESGDGFV